MAGTTPRFGLNFFGGDTPGALDDDANKYTSQDRLTLDAVLSALEQHTHRLVSHVGAPQAIPTATYSQSGALDGATTYYYVVSFVNAAGLETVSGPETSVDTPDPITTPDLPSGETSFVSGNSLDPGLYYYALTSLATAEESTLSDTAPITLVDTDNTVTLTLPALVSGADSIQVWRMGSDEAGWTRIGTSATTTFIDDGSVPPGAYGDPANEPPSVATGSDNYSITLTLTGADVSGVQSAKAWRIYRSTVSGTYDAASLVHEVIERTSETDPDAPLLTSWLDDGDATLTGSPALISSQLSIPPLTIEYADPLPAAGAYPDNYPILDGSLTLYVARSGVWTAISGGSGGSGGSGTQFKGLWDSGDSASPGYPAGTVVVDASQLWQALTSTAGVAPASPQWNALGRFIPVGAAAFFSGSGAPIPEPDGALAGDLYLDTVTGDIYTLDGN